MLKIVLGNSSGRRGKKLIGFASNEQDAVISLLLGYGALLNPDSRRLHFGPKMCIGRKRIRVDCRSCWLLVAHRIKRL